MGVAQVDLFPLKGTKDKNVIYFLLNILNGNGIISTVLILDFTTLSGTNFQIFDP